MADSAVRIVLNAVDQYSGTLTGLNQGLDLVSKAFNGIQKAASVALDAISSGLDLAAKGGAFSEMNNQFNNLADSLNVSGPAIVRQVREVALQTITETEAIRVSTKALAAGLTGEDLTTILNFTKRFTEATGDSFSAMSEQIFTSLASGRYSVLRQMGLVIESGASLTDVVKAAENQVKKFGDSGFNAADNLAALSAAQDDFTRKIGQSINDAPEFQRILANLSKSARDFVDSFDPAAFTDFVDSIVLTLESIFNAFVDNFPGIRSTIDSTFSSGQASARDFTLYIVDAVFQIVNTVGAGINQIIGFIQQVNSNNVLTKIVDGFVQAVIYGTDTVATVITGVIDLILQGFEAITTSLEVILRDAEGLQKIFDAVGIDIDLEGFANTAGVLADTVDEARQALPGLKEEFSGVLESASGESEKLLQNFNEGLEGWKVNLDGVDKKQADIIQKINDIDYSKPIEQAAKIEFKPPKLPDNAIALQIEKALKKGGKSGLNSLKDIYAELVKDLRKDPGNTGIELSVKKVKGAIKELSDDIAETTKIQKDLDRSLGVGVQKTEERTKKATTQVDILKNEYLRLTEILQTGVSATGQELSLFDTQVIENQLTDLRRKLGGKIVTELTFDAADQKSSALKEIIDRVGSVNWPQAWQQMADAFLRMLVAAAAGENIPLAITNYAPGV